MVDFAVPFRAIVDFALPPRCPACSAIVPEPHRFCGTCWQSLDFLAGPCCAGCDLPLPFDPGGDALCGTCLVKRPAHAGIKAAVAYGDIARNVALRLKYGGRIGLARIIADQLARYAPELPHNALLVPVPLHWTRLWARSFNQSALIAQELAQQSGHEHVPDLMLRTRRTQPLRAMAPKERAKTVSGVFAINPRWAEKVSGRAIALVDDVYTSGATTDACVRMLKKQGAASVTIMCWARVLPVGLVRDNSLS